MILKENEIWTKIIELEGTELFTYVDKEKNTIIRVENMNKNSDRIIILERSTYPMKSDIIAAYKLLTIQGKLKRIPDLEWLAQPDKMVSSIVFRIIGEITKNYTQIENSSKSPTIILYN